MPDEEEREEEHGGGDADGDSPFPRHSSSPAPVYGRMRKCTIIFKFTRVFQFCTVFDP